MGDPTGPDLRRREVLESLDRHGVKFVLVGGQAAASHGALRPTRDLDICVLWTPENLDRLGAVLDQFDAGLRLTGDDEPIAVPHRDGRFLMKMDLSTERSGSTARAPVATRRRRVLTALPSELAELLD